MTSDHIGIEHIEWVRSSRMTAGELLRRLYEHVRDLCPECRREWQGMFGGQRDDFVGLLGAQAATES